MMNTFRNAYSIKDLENISGIKAHTIRIWEKRYNILEPMRTDTNIRYYDFMSIKKLLNITLLHNHGYKISKISQYPSEDIPNLVKEIITDKTYKSHAINAFKVAMLNFDREAFLKAYEQLLANKSFTSIFKDVFVPLLNEIGLLWQTNTITAAHEHFITNLIKQKLEVELEIISRSQVIVQDKVFILFLPIQEIHDLGLKYLNYEVVKNGYKTIYLGENIEIEDLHKMTEQFESPVFLTYITTSPMADEINGYITKLQQTILDNSPQAELWITGIGIDSLQMETASNRTRLFLSMDHIIKTL
ncbi:MerR family transcriptional regulator [Flavobacterium tegetincola]|uniref:MerR family transcriptional regulator n=1 Tax=Flavobacterium tegetincola TaxID=150172 RepID=UPI00047BC29F